MDEHKNSKGLSGLSSMLTDVQAIEQRAREQAANEKDNVDSSSRAIEDTQKKQQGQKTNTSDQATNRFGCFGLLAFIALLFIIFAIKAPSDNSSKPQRGNNSVANKPQITYTEPKPTPAPAPAKPAPVPEPQTIPPPISSSASTIDPRPSVSYKNPIQVLQSFHQDITNKQYHEAYNYLSEDFQDSVSYEGWAPGFRTTISSTVSNVKTVSQTDNQAVLTYILKAVDYPGGTRYFQGTATLIKTSDGWKIDEITNKAL